MPQHRFCICRTLDMRKLIISKALEQLTNSAVTVDETSLEEFDVAIKRAIQWRKDVEKIRQAGGGKLPGGGLLLIGSSAFNSLEVGSKNCVVHVIDIARLRRKG